MEKNENLVQDYFEIWNCHNPSGELTDITKEVKKHLKGYNYHVDKHGNIFVGDFKQERPCLVAHLDSVHRQKSDNIYLGDGILSSDNGIGGDDKCGIVAILEILKSFNNINAIFPVDEEIGGVGSSHIQPKKLKNVKYFIEIDRRGDHDIIFQSGCDKIGSDEFKKALSPLMDCYGYSEDTGSFTDLNILCQTSGKSGVNVSAGYYNAHTVEEYVVLEELQYTIDFVKAILRNIDEVFPVDFYEDIGAIHPEESYGLHCILEKAYNLGYDETAINLIVEAYETGQTEVLQEF